MQLFRGHRRPFGRHSLPLGKRVARPALVVSLLYALAGCATADGPASGTSNGGGLIDRTLETLGITKPVAPAVPVIPPMPDLSTESLRIPTMSRKITLRLHAGEILNVDANGRSLSLVARIYKLKNETAFSRVPYDAFTNVVQESKLTGNDIVEVREIVLTPGKRYEVVEAMPLEATHLAVVALFRMPDPQRWKFVFEARSAARTGVTLGMHDCALSVAEGDPIDVPLEVRRLAGMQCPAP